jgi:hypothetical protein
MRFRFQLSAISPAGDYLARCGVVIGATPVDAKAASSFFHTTHRSPYTAPLSRPGKT